MRKGLDLSEVMMRCGELSSLGLIKSRGSWLLWWIGMVCYCIHALYPLHSFWGVQLNRRWDTFFDQQQPTSHDYGARIQGVLWLLLKDAHFLHVISTFVNVYSVLLLLLLLLLLFFVCNGVAQKYIWFITTCSLFPLHKRMYNNNETGVLRICNNHHGHIHIIGKVAQCTSSCTYGDFIEAIYLHNTMIMHICETVSLIQGEYKQMSITRKRLIRGNGVKQILQVLL